MSIALPRYRITIHAKRTKQIALRLLFGVEITLFVYVYIFGAQGIRSWQKIRAEHTALSERISTIKQDIARVEQLLAEWARYPFYREQIAREQLHMAYDTDRVYYYTD